MRRRARRVGALLGLGAVLAVAVASPAGASGLKLNESKYGFTVTLPQGWTAPPLSGSKLTAFINNAKKIDPKLASAISNQVQGAQQSEVRFLAFAPISASTTFDTNINVLTTNQTLGSLSALKSYARAQLGGLDNPKVTTTTKGPLGSVVYATYSAKLTSGQTVHGMQFYATHKGSTYLLTYTSGSTSQRTLNQIVSTWHWTS